MSKIKNFLLKPHPALNLVLIIITIISLVFSIVSTIITIRERHFEAKRVGFIDFIDDVLKVEDFAQNKDIDKIKTTFQEMDKLYLGFEPLMDKESYYVDLLHFKLYQESYIYPTLFKALFGKAPSESLPNWARENLPKDFNPAPGITDLN